MGHNAEKRERGHSSLNGNVDVRIFCERPDNRRAALEWEKVKDGPTGSGSSCIWRSVDFGEDRDGDLVTTLAVRSAGQVDVKPNTKAALVPAQERLLMDTVEQAMIEAGIERHALRRRAQGQGRSRGRDPVALLRPARREGRPGRDARGNGSETAKGIQAVAQIGPQSQAPHRRHPRRIARHLVPYNLTNPTRTSGHSDTP